MQDRKRETGTAFSVEQTSLVTHHVAKSHIVNTLLLLAIVRFSSEKSRHIVVKALLDQGSQISCITERVAVH